MNAHQTLVTVRAPHISESGSPFQVDSASFGHLGSPAGSTRRESPQRTIAVPGVARLLEVQIAWDRADLESAYHMLAANYQARGYEAPSSKLLRFTPYHVLPDTITVVAKNQGRVLATLSLVPDTSLLGLPMESTYGEEIADLRRRGYHLAEATSLADRDLSPREFIQVFKAFIKIVMQYHVRNGGNSWVITVNPRHRNFYLKVLGFERLGPLRAYPAVQGNPAEAFLLDVDLMKANAPAMHQFVFGDQLPDSILESPQWSAEQVAYFGSQSTQTDRRTIRDIALWVEHFGSLPRWQESTGSEEGNDSERPRRVRTRGSVGACGC